MSRSTSGVRPGSGDSGKVAEKSGRNDIFTYSGITRTCANVRNKASSERRTDNRQPNNRGINKTMQYATQTLNGAPVNSTGSPIQRPKTERWDVTARYCVVGDVTVSQPHAVTCTESNKLHTTVNGDKAPAMRR